MISKFFAEQASCITKSTPENFVEILQSALENLGKVLRKDSVYIFLFHPKDHHIEAAYVWNSPRITFPEGNEDGFSMDVLTDQWWEGIYSGCYQIKSLDEIEDSNSIFKHILTSEEINMLSFFGNVVMANIHRQRTLKQNQNRLKKCMMRN